MERKAVSLPAARTATVAGREKPRTVLLVHRALTGRKKEDRAALIFTAKAPKLLRGCTRVVSFVCPGIRLQHKSSGNDIAYRGDLAASRNGIKVARMNSRAFPVVGAS